ncbi:hypothetical protein BASA61_003365 [Batrachochytrium salamandrivorans]|nr:hypothetical protein BASA61_003365 [Batrachochytrium salamandrivorans]
MLLLSLPWLSPRSMQFGMKDSQVGLGDSDGPNTPQESKTVRKDRICSTIISELHSLQEKVDALYSVLWNQIPDSYNLENRASGLEALDVQGWLKSYYKDNPELLLPIKEKFADWKNNIVAFGQN